MSMCDDKNGSLLEPDSLSAEEFHGILRYAETIRIHSEEGSNAFVTGNVHPQIVAVTEATTIRSKRRYGSSTSGVNVVAISDIA